MNVRKAARQAGINYSTVCGRVKLGWPLDKALSTPAIQPRDWGGFTLKQWAIKSGVSYPTLWKRVRLGWTIERAAAEPISPKGKVPKKYPFRGEEKTLKEISGVCGIDYQVLYQRLHRYGWDMGRATSTPIKEPLTIQDHIIGDRPIRKERIHGLRLSFAL